MNGGQEIALGVVLLISGILSIIGSSIIVHLICKSNRELNTYKRIMFGMSVCDILNSSFLAMMAFLMPADPLRPLAIGNEHTCSVLGFFSQFGISVALYNGMLSTYYLIVVRFGIRNKDTLSEETARQVEPLMHFISIGFPLATSTAGAVMGWYGVKNGHCYISDYPRGCEDNPKIPCHSDTLSLVFGMIPLSLTMAVIIVNNIIIYLRVRRNRKIHLRPTLQPEESTAPRNKNATHRASLMRKLSSILQRSEGRLVDFEDQEHMDKKTRALATQCFAYIGAVFFCITFSSVALIIEGLSKAQAPFAILILSFLFYPLQGFFNVLIYTRPHYLKARENYPDKSVFSVCWQVLSGHCYHNTSERPARQDDEPSSPNPAGGALSSRPSYFESPGRSVEVFPGDQEMPHPEDQKDT